MRLLVLLFLLCVTYHSQGQDTSMLFSKSSIIDSVFLKEVALNNIIDPKIVSSIKKSWLNKFEEDLLGKTKIKEPSCKVETTNFYATGQSASFFGEGLFSNVSLEHKVSILSIPISVSGNLMLQDNQVNTRLSSIGISLDRGAILSQLHDETNQQILHQAIDGLSEEQKGVLKEFVHVESVRQVIFSDMYVARKSEIKVLKDSLLGTIVTHQDSIRVDSIEKIWASMETTERWADSIYNSGMSKLNEVQQIIHDLKTNILREQSLLEEKARTGIRQSLTTYGDKKGKWKSILQSLSQFHIGSFRLRGTPFDVPSVPLHGISLEMRRSGYYMSVHYGKEGKMHRKLPDYVQNIRLAGEGRRIFQCIGGIGIPEKSHLHLGFSSIRVKGHESDSGWMSLPKSNVLISLDSRYMVSEEFFVETVGSLSNSDFSGTTSTQELLRGLYDVRSIGGNNMAGLFRVGWKNRKGQSEYTIGYQTVGDRFITLGNLFLVKNRNALRFEGKQRFIQGRGQLKLIYLKGTTSNVTDVNPGIQQDLFSGELSWRLNSRGSRIWASYSPNYYLQNAAGSVPVSYQLNLITAGLQWLFPRSDYGQWMSMFQTTNFSDQSQFGDTSIVTGLWYATFLQNYIADKYSFSAMMSMGFDHGTRDLNIDMDQSFRIHNLYLSHGAQILRRHYGLGYLVGVSGGIQWVSRKNLKFGFDGTYYWSLSEEPNQFYLNSTASWQF